MPQTQHVKAAQILFERPFPTVSHGSFKDELCTQIPRLRAFAVSLCGSVTAADDLVQEALLRAWSNSEKFHPGTNLRAWLFTILRNVFYSQYRRRSREIQDSDGVFSQGIAVAGNQESHLDLADLRMALAKLPAEQREALILVGASGVSYEEAAVICDVEVGTIKSRVSRARTKLSELMGLERPAQTTAGDATERMRRGPVDWTLGASWGSELTRSPRSGTTGICAKEKTAGVQREAAVADRDREPPEWEGKRSKTYATVRGGVRPWETGRCSSAVSDASCWLSSESDTRSALR